MAKLPDLCAALAPVDGRPAEAIEHFARRCREAGVLPNPGRGHAAPDATLSDAVNLLFALNGADNAKDAALHVKLFRQMEPDHSKPLTVSGIFQELPIGIAVSKTLTEAETFGDAIEALISAAPALLHGWLGMLGPQSVNPPWRSAVLLGHSNIEVEFTRMAGDWPSAAVIRIWHRSTDDQGAVSLTIDYERHYTRCLDNYASAENPACGTAERMVKSTIGARTIAAVSLALIEGVMAGLVSQARPHD